jgi:hypothetical protein
MPTAIVKPEYRSQAMKTPNIVTDVPSDTPAHIIEILAKRTNALFEKRALPETEERHYQSVAQVLAARRSRRPVSDQTDVNRQIAEWNKRHVSKQDARALAKKYAPLTLEDISRGLRLGYSEDVFNELRLVALAAEIRQGVAFEAQAPAPRDANNPGAVGDPTQSLRDDDDDDPCNADSKEDHERAVQYHRNQASYAQSMERCAACHAAADLHAAASRLYPDLNSRFAACSASRKLKG